MSPQGVLTLFIAMGLGVSCWIALFILGERGCRRFCLLGLAGVMGWMVLYESQQWNFYSDVPVHLAMIKSTATGGLFPNDPFFEDYPTPLHYSPIHVIGGMLVGGLGLTLEIAWLVLGLVYAGGVFLSSLVFGLALFRDSRVAWVQAFLATCWVCFGHETPAFATSSVFAVMLAMGLLLSSIQRGELKWTSAVLIAVTLGFGVAVRLYPGLPGYLLMLVVLMAMLPRLKGRSWRAKYFVMIVGPLLLAWPWLLLLVVHASTGGVAGVFHWPGWATYLTTRWQDVHFLWGGPLLAKWLCLFMTGAGALCLLFNAEAVTEAARCFLRWFLGGLVVLWLLPVEVMMAPLMTVEQLQRMGEIFGRIVSLCVPMSLAFGLVFVFKGRAVAGGQWKAGWALMMLACLVVLSIGPAARLRLKAEQGRNVGPRLEFLHKGKAGVFDPLKNKVVLSDAWTTYLTQNALGTRGVVIPEGHSSEMVDVAYRRKCIEAFFAGDLSDQGASRLLARYKVDYILVNKALAEGRLIPHLEVVVPEYGSYSPSYFYTNILFKTCYEDSDMLLLVIQPRVVQYER